ncbi:MAG: sensor histidine kinase [Candidatus Nanopelagicales bacterium]
MNNLNQELFSLIKELPGIVILLNQDKKTLYFSTDAAINGLVRDDQIAVKELEQFIFSLKPNFLRANTQINHKSLSSTSQQKLEIGAVELSNNNILLLIEDLTSSLRIEQIRRDFIANISHELKTPVSALELLAEAIKEAGNDVEAIKRFAEKIPKETKRLASFIQDIIDLTKIQSDDPLEDAEEISVSSIVDESIEVVDSIAAKNRVEISVDNKFRDLTVLGDKKQLITALKNLLINAIYHSGDDQLVSLKVEKTTYFVEISVKDSGEGISPEDQLRIFERFYRVDSARTRELGGSGIGLSLVKHICSNHGGRALVESKIGKGATFTMQLPLNMSRENQ